MKTKRLDLRFAVLFAGICIGQIVYWGFWPSVMRNLGYTDTEIGIFSSAATAAGMLLGLLFGFWMDRFNCPRLLIGGVYTCYCAMLALVFRFPASRAVMWLFQVLSMSNVGLLLSFANAWVLKLQKDHPDLSYSRARSFGSLSYAVAGAVCGGILDRTGDVGSLYVALAAWLLIVPVTLLIPKPAPGGDGEGEKIRFLPQFRRLMSSKPFVILLICAMLDNVAAMPITGTFSMVVQSLGGNMTQSGWGFFIQAFSEFFVIFWFGRLVRRWGVKKLYVFGILMTILRSLAIAMARTPWEAVALVSLQSVSFGLTMPSQTLMVSGSADDAFKAAALQVVHLGTSISSVLLSPVQGMLSDRYGMPAMLAAFAAFDLAALGVLALGYRELPDPREYS